MKRLQEKILKLEFQKVAKWMLAVALLVVLVGGVLSGLLLRPQLKELATQWTSYETSRGENERAENQGAQLEKKEHFKRAQSAQSDDLGGLEWQGARERLEPSLTAYLCIGITGLLCAVLFALYWLLVAAWLYKAAITAKMNEALWPMLGLFFNWAAVLLFFVFRAQKKLRQV